MYNEQVARRLRLLSVEGCDGFDLSGSRQGYSIWTCSKPILTETRRRSQSSAFFICDFWSQSR